ncbi:DUF2637 domain-containing protein [Kitasatospora sp. MAP12-44]|nr:DUF2637 domain-containing protein [Kitasatospora sp. MAP12-44]
MRLDRVVGVQRRLAKAIAAGSAMLAVIGFSGSYTAVQKLTLRLGFSWFSYVLPVGVDAGIMVLLALDLLLTWMRMSFPALRHVAWVLAAATIAFNSASGWPVQGHATWMTYLTAGIHAVIPLLFVIVVEAARHAVGRYALLVSGRGMDSVRRMRWLLAPVPTFRLWRRMKLWELRSYDEVVHLEQNRMVYRAQLRFRYGRGWRRSAPVQALMPLKLAKFGVPLDLRILDTLDGPLFPGLLNDDSERVNEPLVNAEPETVAEKVAVLPPAAVAEPVNLVKDSVHEPVNVDPPTVNEPVREGSIDLFNLAETDDFKHYASTTLAVVNSSVNAPVATPPEPVQENAFPLGLTFMPLPPRPEPETPEEAEATVHAYPRTPPRSTVKGVTNRSKRPEAKPVKKARAESAQQSSDPEEAKREREKAAADFRAVKLIEPELTQGEYARRIGRSPGWMSKAVNERPAALINA